MPKGINPEQLYWLLEFGRPKRKISADELKLKLHLIDRPVFFLSTGRTGTLWLSSLFSNAPGIKSFHAPFPDLSAQNCYAYELQKNEEMDQQEALKILGHIFLAGREQLLRYSYKCQRRYLETNNHLSFFAHAIAELLPQALFVHVHRHPGDFVSSGLHRGWYDYEGSHLRQIHPVDKATKEHWPAYSSVQKIAWLWKESNEFIEDFKKRMPGERCFTLNFSSMDSASLIDLSRFAEISINETSISKRLNQRMNDQHFSKGEKYMDWPQEDREALKAICEPLATKYAYTL